MSTPRAQPHPLPEEALLQRYAGPDGYADCYAIDLSRTVSHAEFVEAFYTTNAFRLERWILRVAAKRPSTDSDAAQLARKERETFAAWSVEARAVDQLLLCDMAGHTRSWLMVAALPGSAGTRLYFGSAVVARRDRRTGQRRMGTLFHALLGFHRLYSRLLLRAAASRLGHSPTELQRS